METTPRELGDAATCRRTPASPLLALTDRLHKKTEECALPRNAADTSMHRLVATLTPVIPERVYTALRRRRAW